MQMRWLLASMVAVMLVAATPLRAIAAQFSGPNPIRIDKCVPESGAASSTPHYVPGYYPAGPDYSWRDVYKRRVYQPPAADSKPALLVAFVNTSPVAIANIEFGLVSRGTLIAQVRDVGSFLPGVESKRRYGVAGKAPAIDGIPRCIALHVKWKNGTVWTNPNLPALP